MGTPKCCTYLLPLDVALDVTAMHHQLAAARQPAEIPIEECGEPLIDIRLAGGILFGPPPECPETEADYCLLRLEVYRKLLRVQKSLPNPYRLRLYEGLRNPCVQAILFDQERQRVSERKPNLSLEAIHAETSVLVSPIIRLDGARNTPPHSTGGAVDVEIVDGSGEVIDYGMEIRDWSVVGPDLCAPSCPSLTVSAKRNRSILCELMDREDFVRYEHEWWHFSYGDQYWASRKGRAFALYGTCTPELIAAAGATSTTVGQSKVERTSGNA
jgi:D-alanyl-D-alanine dipeptidase